MFHRRNRRKKASLPNAHRFPKFRPLPPRGAYESGRRAFCASTKPTPAPRRRRRFGRADCARRRSKRQTQCRPPFGAPAFRAHPAARQAKRRPFGAVWSPAPVCHPIRIPSPAGQIGRRNAACPALKPVAALVAFTQQSEQPLKTAGHFYNCSKQRDNRIITSQICQNTPISPKFCDLTAQGASSICPLDRDVNRSHYVFMRLRPNPKFLK